MERSTKGERGLASLCLPLTQFPFARNLPILLAGGGYKHGRYVAHDEDKNTPLCNLFVTLLNDMGTETESFGQSDGALSW